MNLIYRTIKGKARGCRDRDVRIKLELFLLAIRLGNVTEACQRRGFSRRFYYRWWNRFRRSKYCLRSLEEISRRPKSSPKRISQRVEKRIWWYHRRQYGSRMIEAFLAREGIRISRSTICHVLRKRRKVCSIKRPRLNPHHRRYELVIPGQRLQMDVKYVPELVAGKRAYCYVIVDECTRWRAAYIYDQVSAGTTVEFLDRVLKICPFPIHKIQTDNGQEFTYALNPVARHLDHPMDEWCQKRGIKHQLIPPGVKELNGKVERSHRIDEQYFYWRASQEGFLQINRQLRDWIEYYNRHRPHGGLGYLTPLEKLSERRMALQKPNAELSEDLQALRLRFIQGTPMSFTTADIQLLRLETELQSLLGAA